MGLLARLRNRLDNDRHSGRVADELAFHIDMRTEENIARGMTPSEARAAAERAFGNRTQLAERTRDVDVPLWLDRAGQMLEYSFRSMRLNAGVTVVLILSLALGIGANTAMFSLLYGLLLRPLPVRDPGSLQAVMVANASNFGWVEHRGALNYPLYRTLRDSHLFAELFAYAGTTLDLTTNGQIRLLPAAYVTSDMWSVLGLPPVLGRTTLPSDERTAVISEHLWENEFHRDPGVIGRSIRIGGRPVTVVGVAPARFFGMYVGTRAELFLPLEAMPWVEGQSSMESTTRWWLSAVGRMKPGVSAEQVTALGSVAMRQTLSPEIPKDWAASYLHQTLEVSPAGAGFSDVRRRLTRPLLVASGLVALLLLLACANIASLQMSRGLSRRREFAVRLALGASRRLVGPQVLCENVIVSLIGAALGVAISYPAATMLANLYTTAFEALIIEVRPDARVLAFTAATAILAALVFGVGATFQAMRTDASETLRAPRSARGLEPVRRWLLAAQIGLAVIVVSAAMLFGSTLRNLLQQDPGFRADHVTLLQMEVERAGITAPQRSAFYRRMLERLKAIPGVDSAAISYVIPLGGGVWEVNAQIEGPGGRRSGQTHVHVVSPEFLRTYGTPLQEGQPGEGLILVNRVFVERLAGGSVRGTRLRAKVGGRIEVNAEIGGVVADAKYANLRSPVPPTIYVPMSLDPEPPAGIAVGVRTGGPSLAAIEQIRAALTELNPNIAFLARPFETQVADSVVNERAIATVSGLFGALALLLSAIGVYGLAAYSVAQRRSEIGIRMALGATAGRILALMTAQIGVVVGAGVLAGIVGAVFAARFAQSLLYEVTPSSAWVYVAAGLVLLAVALIGLVRPLTVAARLQPAETLRGE